MLSPLKQILHITFLILFSYSVSGQHKKITYSVFYASNVSHLSLAQQQAIDSLLKEHAFESITLVGYADTVGNAKANLKISKDRAKGIESFIHSKISTAKIITSANGETHNTLGTTNLNQQRRVDIVLHLSTITSIEEVTQKQIVEINKKSEIEIVSENVKNNAKNAFIHDLLTSDKLIIENLLFEPGKTNFLYDKIPNELYYLADILDSIPTLKIAIEGHVCCVDDMKLSQERAKSVYLFLRGNGIDKSRMTFKGFSNSQPLVEEKTATDQQKNRRVEITVLSR